MTHKEFISQMAKDLDKSHKEMEVMVDTVVATIAQNLEVGSVVRIPEFGKFEARKHYERIIANPETGTRKLVPPRLSITFTPAFAVLEQPSREEL